MLTLEVIVVMLKKKIPNENLHIFKLGIDFGNLLAIQGTTEQVKKKMMLLYFYAFKLQPNAATYSV